MQKGKFGTRTMHEAKYSCILAYFAKLFFFFTYQKNMETSCVQHKATRLTQSVEIIYILNPLEQLKKACLSFLPGKQNIQ